jgi:hypothetical protein
MDNNKPHTFKILGYEAVLLNGRVEVSAPDEDVGSKIMLKLGGAILDNKIRSLRINLPNKIVFITAKDKEHLLIKGAESNNKREMN